MLDPDPHKTDADPKHWKLMMKYIKIIKAMFKFCNGFSRHCFMLRTGTGWENIL
jgi:hypothetical protein